MTKPRDIAIEWMLAYGFEPPEFLDVSEYVDEFHDDVFAESGELYSEVYAAIEHEYRLAYVAYLQTEDED